MILGLPPPSADKFLLDVTLEICRKVEVELKYGNIQAYHRLPARVGEHPFIIKFVNRYFRDRVQQTRCRARLTTKSFDGDVTKQVFFNEHLTPLSRIIFHEAKNLKTVGFQFIWIRHGNTYVKKNVNSVAIELKLAQQASNLLADGGAKAVIASGSHGVDYLCALGDYCLLVIFGCKIQYLYSVYNLPIINYLNDFKVFCHVFKY